MGTDSDDGEVDLFQEPADFYQPEKEATFASHQLLSGTDLNIRLVGHNPLWVRRLLADGECTITMPSSLLFHAHLVPPLSPADANHSHPCCWTSSFCVLSIATLTFLGPLSLERGANHLNISRRACQRARARQDRSRAGRGWGPSEPRVRVEWCRPSRCDRLSRRRPHRKLALQRHAL